MTSTSDRELLARYVRRQDHEAFAELVRRYIALVRSAAMRQTREPGLAEDVTQAAIIVLARRAREIPANVVLASWLFTVTHHIAQNALKSRARRTAHEQLAATMRANQYSTDSTTRDLRDVLDVAIARLPDVERGGVVLHYFNDRTHEEIADALGMSSEAVRKRLGRAVIKLRDFVAGRGFDLSTQTLATALAAESVSHLGVAAHATHSVVSVALLSTSNGAAPTTTSVILANGILGSAKSALKWKIAASIALTAIGLTGIATFPLPAPSVQATATVNQTTAPATQPSGFVAQVTPEIRFTALGCAPHPAEPENWFGIDGKPIDMPHERLADNNINTDGSPDRQIAFLIEAPASTRFVVNVNGAYTNSVSTNSIEGNTSMMRSRFGLNDPNPETLSISFHIATSDWKTVATAECGDESVEADADVLGPVTFEPPVDDARWGPKVVVRHARADVTIQLVAIDANGKEHLHETLNNDNDGGDMMRSSFIFPIPAKDIRSVKLQIREFDKRVEFTNIAMQAEQHTEPKIVVTDLKPKK